MKTWVKLDDDLPWNAKIRALAPEARWAYVASICYAAHNLTDGRIPDGALALVDGTRRIAATLINAGLWEASPGGWTIHDFLKHNRSREQAERISEERSRAGKLGKFAQQTAGSLSSKPLAKSKQSDLSPSALLSAPELIDLPSSKSEGQIGQTAGNLPDTSPPSEALGIMLLAQPKASRDPSLWDECSALAALHTYAEIEEAIRRQRSTKGEDGRPLQPYPSVWRRFLDEPQEPVQPRPANGHKPAGVGLDGGPLVNGLDPSNPDHWDKLPKGTPIR